VFKLLGMTASSHDNEALSAIRLANRALAEHKVSWREAFAPVSVPPPPPPSDNFDYEDTDETRDFPDDWRSAARFCSSYGTGVLTRWELNFCQALTAFPRLSEKQKAVLRHCYAKVAA
jgi:hypothetical protein